MYRARPKSVSSRLALLILIAITPALLLFLYDYREHQGHEAREARTEVLRVARAIAVDHEKAVENARTIVLSVAHLPSVRAGVFESYRPLLRSLMLHNAAVGDLCIVDANGDTRCSGTRPYEPSPSSAVRASAAARFRSAAAAMDAVISDLQRDASGKMTFFVTAPVPEPSGDPKYAVSASVNFEPVDVTAKSSGLPIGCEVVVVDRQGACLAWRPNAERDSRRSAAALPVVRAAVSTGRDQVGEFGDEKGNPFLWGCSPVRVGREPVGYVAVAIPSAIAFAEFHETQFRVLGLCAVVIALIAAVTYGMSSLLILRTVNALSRAASKIAVGDLGARTGLTPGPDDLGQCVAAFDNMAAALQRRDAELNIAGTALRESEARYRQLFEGIPLPAVVYDETDMAFLVVNDAAVSHLGYSREELLGMTLRDIVPEDDVGSLAHLVAHDGPGQDRHLVRRYRRRDGSLAYLETVSHRMTYSGRSARLVIASDVTERQKAADQLQQSFEQVRKLAQHLQSVREEERSYVAREIHDELGQALTGLKMDLAWLMSQLSKETDVPPTAVVMARIEATTDLVDSTIQTVRRVASELRPAVLDAFGLVPAMEWQARDFQERTGIVTTFTSDVDGDPLGKDCSTALFRIMQESLTNVARHAQATHVSVTLGVQPHGVRLDVVDNGIGITEAALSAGESLGLLGMRERAMAFGGEVRIKAGLAGGTTLTAFFVCPCPARQESCARNTACAAGRKKR